MKVLSSFSNDVSYLLESSYYLETEYDPNKVLPAKGHSYILIKDLVLLEENIIDFNNGNSYGNLLTETKNEILELTEYFPINTFSPYVNLFFNLVNIAIKKNYSDTELLEHLKREINTDSFRQEVQQKRKAISKNKQSLLRYIESLFECHSRLLVLRVDFSYKKDEFGYITTSKNKRINTYFDFANKELLEEWSIEVREQRNQFINQLKKNYKKNLVGYVWKLEYNADKAFHYHMIFFLDASKHHYQNVKIAESIGEIWKHEITNGKGIYWNYNANTQNLISKHIVIGDVKYNNKKLRVHLDTIVSYLTKPDYFVKLTLPNGTRTLGKGGKPKK